MLKQNIFRVLIFISALSITSCVNKKKIIYFQGDKAIASDTTKKHSSFFKIDDLLMITIMSMDAEATKPFNLSTYGANQNSLNSASNTNSNLKGYLIDENGEIDFPVIGKIKLAGLNRTGASELIKEKLKDYLKDPIVHIEIQNFNITILGDVSKPGNYIVNHERITIIEAIGLAGDLNISGLRKNVLVIRDNNGIKTETRIDLTGKEVFNSPVFYLQQNDVIYVEQNRAKKNASAINAASISILVSLTTLVLTFITLLTR
ncbi:MAG: polysaccharide biosynthesis/export family protein [Bacteroidota bacterium]|nr:polysaccharide biosynthesis/export family protein [Bacteroidota bacterium]MDP3147443.1 polysaccharide biosynthesis/export family protein [Bacteroidota bacterium]